MIKYLVIICFLIVGNSYGQGSYEFGSYNIDDHNVKLYDFKMGGNIKVKYFARNAYANYQSWRYSKNILLICSGAFSETWEPDSRPVGFTVDNGLLVNRSIDPVMDGLVGVYDTHIEIMDLDQLESGFTFDDGSVFSLNPRGSASDRSFLATAAVEGGFTIFQTQLVYSEDKYSNFSNLYYGKKRERRFLALCTKRGYLSNVIVDITDNLYLNQAAKFTKEVLEYADFNVHYIVNLDTGDKNIFALKENGSLYYQTDYKLNQATNLIIFYTE